MGLLVEDDRGIGIVDTRLAAAVLGDQLTLGGDMETPCPRRKVVGRWPTTKNPSCRKAASVATPVLQGSRGEVGAGFEDSNPAA